MKSSSPFKALCVVLALLLSVVAVLSHPHPELKDIHRTVADIYPGGTTVRKDGSGSFVVSVERLDALVDIEGHRATEVAERLTHVVLAFDVTPQGEIRVNNAPVPLGVTNLQIHAAVAVGRAPGSAMFSPKQIMDSLDVGIVNVQVTATEEKFDHKGIRYTRITVTEKVTEVNGAKVAQDQMMHQAVELYPDGYIRREAPCAVQPHAHSQSHSQSHDQQHSCVRTAAVNLSRWYHNQTESVQTGVFVAVGLMVSLTFFAISRVAAAVIVSHMQYDVLPIEDIPVILVNAESAALPLDEKELYVEKLLAEEDELPTYTPGYAPVPSDEESQK